jgi:hypothetical protein
MQLLLADKGDVHEGLGSGHRHLSLADQWLAMDAAMRRQKLARIYLTEIGRLP